MGGISLEICPVILGGFIQCVISLKHFYLYLFLAMFITRIVTPGEACDKFQSLRKHGCVLREKKNPKLFMLCLLPELQAQK